MSCIITQDSKHAVVVSKKNEKCSMVKIFNLESYERVFKEKFEGSYIKIKEVEQNFTGNFFAVAFNDDGIFKLRTFGLGKERRSEGEIQKSECVVNDLLKLNDWTMTLDGFYDPFITLCFISDTQLYVNLYHNSDFIHYHFIWNFETNKIQDDKVAQHQMSE